MAASPTPAANEAFVAAGYGLAAKVYNELSPGNTANGSYSAHGAIELGGALKVALEGDLRNYRYAHDARQVSLPCSVGTPGCNTLSSTGQFQTGLCPSADPGCVNVIGGNALATYTGRNQAYVSALMAQESALEVHVDVKILDPRIYLGAGYYRKNYGYLAYPAVSGAGAGISKLPDLERSLSLYGSAWYYPNVSGTYAYPTSPFLGPFSGAHVPFGYSIWTYKAGAALNLGKSGIFVDGGWAGEYGTAKANAPASTSVNGAFIGLGWHP